MFRDWWSDLDFEPSYRTSRLLDQHFGSGLKRDDLFSSVSTRPSVFSRTGYVRPWVNSNLARQDSGSTVNVDKEKYTVILDVAQFTPEEITVKTANGAIVVEGKHEEKQDEHGYVSRHFTRRYTLPQGHNAEDVVSTLSSDGVLTISGKNSPFERSSSP